MERSWLSPGLSVIKTSVLNVTLTQRGKYLIVCLLALEVFAYFGLPIFKFLLFSFYSECPIDDITSVVNIATTFSYI